ncbi:Uncharacterised protein [Mycobacteroides abscessus subsp. abscessus]|nr:Uncharacterised protein [Mycobacteroides abscessus subsp. abscessus]
MDSSETTLWSPTGLRITWAGAPGRQNDSAPPLVFLLATVPMAMRRLPTSANAKGRSWLGDSTWKKGFCDWSSAAAVRGSKVTDWEVSWTKMRPPG